MNYSTSCAKVTQHRLRALLRETAQPVAVVTSFMPPGCDSKYHGATLSSFTSIAMDPYPLITFSLRTPSRMGTSLKSYRPSRIVLNILSALQAPTALTFSRPDLYPDPFSTIPFSLSEEGLPTLEGSLGALSCEMLPTSLSLDNLEFPGKRTGKIEGWEGDGDDCVVSELFIARVTRVEDLALIEGEDDSLRTLPLLYHRRGFTSCAVTVLSESKS